MFNVSLTNNFDLAEANPEPIEIVTVITVIVPRKIIKSLSGQHKKTPTIYTPKAIGHPLVFPIFSC